MRVAQDRARWREVGEAYIQQWTGVWSGLIMSVCRDVLLTVQRLGTHLADHSHRQSRASATVSEASDSYRCSEAATEIRTTSNG
jgi:hypothetical protein